ncbi:MAG: flagellar biosynthesis anti-sigma factor FlgM [Phycisphaeraceae bacterium]
MSDIAPVSGSTPPSYTGGGNRVHQPSQEASSTRSNGSADRVEFSPGAQYLSKLRELPDVRHDLISSIRQQLADDTYTIEDKLDAAIDDMAEDLI